MPWLSPRVLLCKPAHKDTRTQLLSPKELVVILGHPLQILKQQVELRHRCREPHLQLIMFSSNGGQGHINGGWL